MHCLSVLVTSGLGRNLASLTPSTTSEMADKIGILLPQNRSYETVAGFVLAELQHIPKTGEYIETSGWRFEVIDLEGRRIDKILAARAKIARRVISS